MNTGSRFLIVFLFIFSLSFFKGIAQSESSGVKPNTFSADETVIKTVVTQFLEAFSKKNISVIASLLGENSPNFAMEKQKIEKLFAENENIIVNNVVFGKIEIKNERAKVYVNAEISTTDLKTGKNSGGAFGSSNRFFELFEEKGNWKISEEMSAEKELALRLIAIKNSDERERMLSKEQQLIEGSRSFF